MSSHLLNSCYYRGSFRIGLLEGNNTIEIVGYTSPFTVDYDPGITTLVEINALLATAILPPVLPITNISIVASGLIGDWCYFTITLTTTCPFVEIDPPNVIFTVGGISVSIIVEWGPSGCKCDCYKLTDCTGLTPIIITNTDLSEYVGQVIRICTGGPGTEFPRVCICYIVEVTDCCIIDDPIPTGIEVPERLEHEPCVEVPITGTIECFPDCECCLPPVPPEPEPPFQPSIPEIDKHTYRICEKECDIQANKVFANMTYEMFKYKQYGIESCCPKNLNKIWIQKELSDFSKLIC